MTGVARETPPPPAGTSVLFGDRLPYLTAYADALCTAGVATGLIGPREVARIWPRHLLNCGVVVPALPAGIAVADVGSGAGLPGLVWAAARTDLQVTLIEPRLRPCRFLADVVHALELANVEVVRARAEELGGSRSFDVVAARAVAPLERLVRWCLPLVSPGGRFLALKGASAAEEIAAARAPLRAMNAENVHVELYGEGMVEPPTTVVAVTRPESLR